MTKKTFHVAIAQIEPEFLSLEASMDKVEHYLCEAAARNVQLITFGETWLSGYPAWLDCIPTAALWDFEPAKLVYQRMVENAVDVGGKHVRRLAVLAKTYKMGIVMGVNERVLSGKGRGTLFNSILTFNEKGVLVNHHRKLMPTYTEKMVYGLGDGHGLKRSSIHGVDTGSLVCWEHWMPHARQAMHDAGEDVHVAAWPTAHERHQIASRHYAFEGRCFVLCAGQILRAEHLPAEFQADIQETFVLKGGSSIIGPDASYLEEPVWEKEGLLTHELDLGWPTRERMTLDVSGHYNRPDVFHFEVNQSRPV